MSFSISPTSAVSCRKIHNRLIFLFRRGGLKHLMFSSIRNGGSQESKQISMLISVCKVLLEGPDIHELVKFALHVSNADLMFCHNVMTPNECLLVKLYLELFGEIISLHRLDLKCSFMGLKILRSVCSRENSPLGDLLSQKFNPGLFDLITSLCFHSLRIHLLRMLQAQKTISGDKLQKNTFI